MRKIIALDRITVDGFFAGPNGEIDWFVLDPELDVALFEMVPGDTALFGGTTYELFEAFWPDALKHSSSPQHKVVAEALHNMTKVVFDKNRKEVTWHNSKLFNDNLIEETKKLKSEKGGDILIFGSGTIVKQLTEAGLIDEYVLIMTPVILGEGKALFEGNGRHQLKLKETRTFDSGNVALHYVKSK